MTALGTCDPRFEGVRAAFEASLDAGDDLGGAVAVYLAGEPVVDLWGGWQDRAQTVPWTRDTLACVYSSGKAVLSALILTEVAAGRMDYDAPVTDAWPEFGAHGKNVTLAQALSHQHGVPGFAEPREPAIWLDWDACCAAISDAEPMWQPGTASGYGPQTFGFVAGELYRRAASRRYGEALRALGDQVLCGLSDADQARASRMTKPPRAPDLGEITPETRAAFLERWSSPGGVDRRVWAAAEIPASNTHATARGLAGVMQALSTGRLGDARISDAARGAMTAERISGPDRVLPFDLSWAAGVMRERPGGPQAPLFGGSPTAVGHYGFGGSCVVADSSRELSFAYVPNRMSEHLVGDPRATTLLAALEAAL